MEFHRINSEIVNECGSAVGVFINPELAEKFLNAYNHSILSESQKKTAQETELIELKKCFKEFNEYLERGGIISNKSIVHFGIKSLLNQ